MAGDLINKIEVYDPAARLSNDVFLLDLMHKVIAAFMQTHYPGTVHSVAVQFVLAQWRYLELQARFDWLITYQPRFQSRERGVGACRQSLVGALVDNESEMDSLHRAGVPVWLHVPQHSESHKILTTLSFPSYSSDEEPIVPMRDMNSLPAAFSLYCPECVFQGSPRDPECYQVMYDCLKGTVKGVIWSATPRFQGNLIANQLK
jgi:hypothetical protein